MRVCRSRLTRNFTIVPNEPIQSEDMSLLASGLLAYLLSLPDGTRVTVRTLAASREEGRDRIGRALRELEARGYRRRVNGQDARGRWFVTVYVYDRPYTGEVADTDGSAGAVGAGEVAGGVVGAAGCAVDDDVAADGSGVSAGVHEPPAPPVTLPERRALPPVRSARHDARVPSAPPVPPKVKRRERRAAKVAAREAEKAGAAMSPVHAQAVGVLAALGRSDRRLALRTAEVNRLAPATAVHLATGVSVEALTSALGTGLPALVYSPVAFLAHRLEQLGRTRPVDGVDEPGVSLARAGVGDAGPAVTGAVVADAGRVGGPLLPAPRAQPPVEPPAECRLCGVTFPPSPGRPDTCKSCATSPQRDERNRRGAAAARQALRTALAR